MKSLEYGPEPQPKYEYFTKSKDRHNLYEFSKQLGTYLHDQRIPSVVFLDRASRPDWVGLDEYWKNNYPEETRPNIFFLNPEGFDLTSRVGKKIDEISSKSASKQGINFNFSSRFRNGFSDQDILMNIIDSSEAELVEQFERAYKKLEVQKDQPVAIFDNCMHTGTAMRPVLSYLKKMGYQDVRVVIGTNDDNRAAITVDKVLVPNPKIISCYPFGHSSLSGVKKGENVFSDYDEKADRSSIVLMRQEIRRAVQNKGK